MKNMIALLCLAVFPAAAAAAQEQPQTIWTDLAASRSSSLLQGQGGQVAEEEFLIPNMRASLSVFGRVSFPGETLATNSGVSYWDILNPGLGFSVEGDILAELAPHWLMGGYVTVGWDWFKGQDDVDMGTGEFFTFDRMKMTTVIVGLKVVERVGPYIMWEGHMGGGYVRYGSLMYTDVTAAPVPGLQFFQPVTRGVFEIGGRVGFGDRRFTFDLGLGIRIMGAMSPGANANPIVVDPDFFYTYVFEAGLTLRF